MIYSMKDKLVSVIIPTYNRAHFLRETMNSVWNQTHRPIEMIVVDDGSTDDTQEVVTDWIASHSSDNFDAKYVYQENQGAPVARNRGAHLAQGQYLMFLDSDDLLTQNVLQSLAIILRKSSAGLGACPWMFIEKKGTDWVEKEGIPLGNQNSDLLKRWLCGWYIPPCALLWKTPVYQRTGGWDESLSANQDGDLVVRYLLGDGRIAFSDEGKSLYRKHPDTISVSEKVTMETLRSREKVLDKVHDQLQELDKFGEYKHELATAYYMLACKAYFHNFREYGDHLYYEKLKVVDHSYQTSNRIHSVLEQIFGPYYKEQIHRLVNYLLPGRSV